MRIIAGEPGLARALRDAGHEVIFIGTEHTPEQIVVTAIQEDADLIGLAAGADDQLESRLTTLLEERDVDDIDITVLTPDQARALR